MEFLLIRLSLAVFTASYRHLIQLFLSGFREIAIYRKNVRRTKSLVLRMMQPAVQQNTLKLRTPSKRLKRTPPRSSARCLLRNGQPRRRPEYTPGSNTRFRLHFVSMTFLQQGGASWMKFVRQSVVVKMRRGKDGPRCRRSYDGKQ